MMTFDDWCCIDIQLRGSPRPIAEAAWEAGLAEGIRREQEARPRLAKEHVDWLREIAECSEYGMRAYEELIQASDPDADLAYIREYVASYKRDVDAIRAALAALGEG